MIEKKQKLPDYRQFLHFSNPPLFAKSGGLEKKRKEMRLAFVLFDFVDPLMKKLLELRLG